MSCLDWYFEQLRPNKSSLVSGNWPGIHSPTYILEFVSEYYIFSISEKKRVRHLCLTFSLLYLFICSCKFVTETRLAHDDIAHDEN